jgi:hypothetical protein
MGMVLACMMCTQDFSVVYAVEISPRRAAMAANNAAVYGVDHKVEVRGHPPVSFPPLCFSLGQCIKQFATSQFSTPVFYTGTVCHKVDARPANSDERCKILLSLTCYWHSKRLL